MRAIELLKSAKFISRYKVKRRLPDTVFGSMGLFRYLIYLFISDHFLNIVIYLTNSSDVFRHIKELKNLANQS